ncbi:MAG TPA: hemerythrin domain-containing protein [Acidimicrobiia bacterium]
MDITKVLEADHRQVEDLFAKISRAEGSDRPPLIEELATSLRGHMDLEESELYPNMGRVTGEESVEEANEEHDLTRKGLDDMISLAPDDPGFGAALDSVKAGVMHHVKEEEGEIFPALRKEGTVLVDIATPFMQRRLDLGMPMPASALAAASTKEELLHEASNAEIKGASSMSKDELAEALAAKMS